MGPRPEERAHQPNAIEEDVLETDTDANGREINIINDAIAVVGNHRTTGDPETTDSTEAWARAEGYTPLSDLNTDGGFDGADSYQMFSTGPGAADSNSDSNSDGDSNSNSNGDDQIQGGSATGTFFADASATGGSGGAGQDDFEQVAAGALSALEEEYKQTLALSQGGVSEAREKDEDLRIIGAGFDQRNEELQQIRRQGGFVVHQEWEGPEKKTPPAGIDASGKGTNARSERPGGRPQTSNVDTDAVRKAIQSLSTKNRNASFQQKFATWQQQQQQTNKNTDHSHVLIPKASRHEFYRPKPTPASRRATANLTRSATLAEAMVRLSLLAALPDDCLLIDVVGVDHVECQNASTIRDTFRPFVRWVRDYLFFERGQRRIRIHFRLIGRELMTTTEGVVDLMESAASSISATATCHSGVYHEFLDERLKLAREEGDQKPSDGLLLGTKIAPDLAVAFNAGIWGYQEWATTIQYLASFPTASLSTAEATAAIADDERTRKIGGIPIVITAYTLDECQEDQEVISEAIASMRTEEANEGTGYKTTAPFNPCRAEILWESERNPFGSQVTRETKGSTQEYRENSCWQAWRLGS